MQKIVLFIIFIITAILSGCKLTTHIPRSLDNNKSYESRISTYQNKDCCVDFENMKISKFEDKLDFTMEENKRTFKLGSIISPYQLFALDSKPETHYYSIKSFFLNDKYAFFPTVSVLDANFKILNMTHPSNIGFKQEDLYDDAHFWLYFSVNKEANPNAKYLLVHTLYEIGGELEVNVPEQTNVQSTMIGDQSIIYAENTQSSSFNPEAAPSGILTISKLGFWNKPVNSSLIQDL